MNMSQAIAARDFRGAENEAVDYALECIFGGGHGYERGDKLTSADEDTCRECADEALNEYSQAVDGEPAPTDWIDRVTERAIESAQSKIDSLD